MHPPSATYREFHVSRVARDRYQFDQALFSLTGNMVFADFHAARLSAQRINRRRALCVVLTPSSATEEGPSQAPLPARNHFLGGFLTAFGTTQNSVRNYTVGLPRSRCEVPRASGAASIYHLR